MSEPARPVGDGPAGATTSREVTDQVLASLAAAPSPRLRRVLERLVSHLHDFARDVDLTEDEWAQGIEFLTRVGHMTTEQRQEWILLSDVLGLSMVTVGLNQPPSPEATEATVFGPFFLEGSPHIPLGGDVAGGIPGPPCWIEGTVRDTRGEPIPGARVEVWEADAEGFYDVQRPGEQMAGRAHLFTATDGGYRFWSVKPSAYPIPDDGPVGDLLSATGRGPMRPAHVHFMVSAPGYHTLVTHIFVAGDPHLDHDAVFGVKRALIVDFHEQPPGAGPDGAELDTTWYRAAFDIVLVDDPAPAASR